MRVKFNCLFGLNNINGKKEPEPGGAARGAENPIVSLPAASEGI
jgi:hypothetical protein